VLADQDSSPLRPLTTKSTFAALLGRLGVHPHELEEPLACEWALKPV
jgi:hypothetical protein